VFEFKSKTKSFKVTVKTQQCINCIHCCCIWTVTLKYFVLLLNTISNKPVKHQMPIFIFIFHSHKPYKNFCTNDTSNIVMTQEPWLVKVS